MTMIRSILLVLLATFPLAAAQSGPGIGEPAPVFTLPDTRGETHALARYRGSWVVLEWTNYGCPFVKKHYRTGNIPSQQREWRGQGVVWLSIVSSSPGTQGYYGPAGLDSASVEMGSEATALLMDPEGTVGRAYEARTTPHMFVIDPDGVLVYMGGIDDVPTSRDEDLERATQLVDQALTQATAGNPVSVPTSRPYGCTVKYR
ncbi:MAG: redoxin domain-containing protein [Gemmatimonadetes bacterium]|nr:redoxin domain-containing protein [Gemmatimonadota bacterium]NIQ57416.1 redoxin domain-containing protein [Gemmatimonadota bacterium]NIU77582.1 redoxin domain-containing protein [Gammaproteobacteria bacterium]NIX46764.1 redoxin domain-containing protein [Gemmatimonadota bacterium]NIY11118.1 redoxin domain-containing protein [Gemmatimonadota bacterium]